MSNYPPQSFHPHPTRRKYIIATTPGNPDWPCLDTVHCPDGRLKIVQKKDGNQFVVCDHNEFNNPSTCKVTLSLLKANRDFPHNCQLCLQDVGGSLHTLARQSKRCSPPHSSSRSLSAESMLLLHANSYSSKCNVVQQQYSSR